MASNLFTSSLIKELKQTGKRISIKRDASRKGSMPGKRVSKNGKVYWETRKNRTDMYGENL